MWSWDNPVYNRDVALWGPDDLQARFSQASSEYNDAYQNWLNQQPTPTPPGIVVGDPTDPIGGGGPPAPITVGDPTDPYGGGGPPFPSQAVGDPTDPPGGGGPPFPFEGPIHTPYTGNPPSGPTTIQDMPLLESIGSGPPMLPVQPHGDDLARLMEKMQLYKQNNQNAYANQMGGGWAGGAFPADMQQRFADGGEFSANPTSGVRPTNPFAQDQTSYGQPGQPTGASYGATGGLGGLGGVGGSSPFQIQNPFAPR